MINGEVMSLIEEANFHNPRHAAIDQNKRVVEYTLR